MPPKKNESKKKKNKSRKRNSAGGIPAKLLFQGEELREIAALVTPFAAQAMGARVCDSSCPNSIGITVHAQQTLSVSAAGAAIIQFNPMWGPNRLPYIVDSLGAGADWFLHAMREATPYGALYGMARVVGLGMKISSLEPLQTRSGTVTAGVSDSSIALTATTTRTIAQQKSRMSHTAIYSLIPPDDGCQMRWQALDSEEYQFQYLTDGTGSALGLQGLNTLPTAIIEGAGNATQYMVETIAHLEYNPSNDDVVTGTPAPFGERHDAILAAASRHPFTASGHSFIDFAKTALSVAKTLASITHAVGPILEPLLM